MKRAIGKFVHPENGREFWAEPDTVSMVKLSPDFFTLYKDKKLSEIFIDYKISNDFQKKEIFIQGFSDVDGKLSSEKFGMDELKFCESFANAVLSGQEADTCDAIKDLKSKIIKELSVKLIEKRALLNSTAFEGSGFVKSKDLKVMTIESIKIVSMRESRFEILLEDCVGAVSLVNLIEPKIEFYIGKYRMTLENISDIHEQLKQTKGYSLTAEKIDIKRELDPVVFEKINKEKNYPELLTGSRQKYLDNCYEQDSDLDDRFGDLF